MADGVAVYVYSTSGVAVSSHNAARHPKESPVKVSQRPSSASGSIAVVICNGMQAVGGWIRPTGDTAMTIAAVPEASNGGRSAVVAASVIAAETAIPNA